MKAIPAGIFSGLLLICSHSNVRACLNEYYFDRNGDATEWTSPMPVFFYNHDTIAARAFIKNYNLDNLEQYDFTFQSDIGVKLTYLGEYKRALEIFTRLEKQHPQEYTIAANLGTLYELNGNNRLAIEFIKKGMELNPGAHEGSEWVHVKILEAKLAIKQDRGWLSGHSVLGTGINFNSFKDGSATRSSQIKDIEYQLKERIPFTKFPDPVLANVLNELGDLYSVEASAEMAYVAFELCSRNAGDAQYELAAKKTKLAAVLKKHGVPIPDWHYHYRSVYENELEAVVKKDLNALSQVDPKYVAGGLKKIGEMINDNNAARERQRRYNIIMGISAAIVLLFAGLVVYFARKKKTPYKI